MSEQEQEIKGELLQDILKQEDTLTTEFVTYAHKEPEYAHRLMFEGSGNW